MRFIRVFERRPDTKSEAVVEIHDVTHRRPCEVMRLRHTLELAYDDRDRFVIEEAITR